MGKLYEILDEMIDRSNSLETVRSDVLQVQSDIEDLADTITGTVGIDDETTGIATTWSSSKIDSEFTSQSSRITQLDANVKSTAQAKADYHMGFYRDADGDLCEA